MTSDCVIAGNCQHNDTGGGNVTDTLRDRRINRLKLTVSALDVPSRWVGPATAWLIVSLVGVLVYGAVMRYGLDAPPIWAYDITYMLCGSLFMLGAAYTLQCDEHVRADFLYQFLSPRWQSAIDAAFILFFPGDRIRCLGFFSKRPLNGTTFLGTIAGSVTYCSDGFTPHVIACVPLACCLPTELSGKLRVAF